MYKQGMYLYEWLYIIKKVPFLYPGYPTGIYKQLTKTTKHDTTLVAMQCTYCKSVIPFNHSALVKNPIDLASNFHARTNITI